jgi:hypothetical protein
MLCTGHVCVFRTTGCFVVDMPGRPSTTSPTLTMEALSTPPRPTQRIEAIKAEYVGAAAFRVNIEADYGVATSDKTEMVTRRGLHSISLAAHAASTILRASLPPASVGSFQASYAASIDALFAAFDSKHAAGICRLLHNTPSHFARILLAAIDSRVGLPLGNPDARLLIPSTKAASNAVDEVSLSKKPSSGASSDHTATTTPALETT